MELVTSSPQIAELKRVMEYPKFSFTEEQKARFLSIILEIAVIVEIPGKVNVIEKDPDDNAMLETAIVGNVDYLISGDPHLLTLKEFARTKIITASEFLETTFSSSTL